MDAAALEPFSQACELASRVISDAEVARRWHDASALRGFTVGAVAAHLYTATRRLEAALDEDLPARPRVVELADYYGTNRVDDASELTAGVHAFLRDDAERRAERGHEVIAQRFGEVVARLAGRLPDEAPERLIPVVAIPDGVTPLNSYLTTRVVELVVHADDLVASVGLPAIVVPGDAAAVVIDVFVGMARHRTGDLGVIRAFARSERAGHDVLRVL